MVVSVGEVLVLRFGPVDAGHGRYFENLSGAKVEVPEGAELRFPRGFLVRQYGGNGSGSWGTIPKDFWTVKFQKKDGVDGVLLPAGVERSYYYSKDRKGKRRRHCLRLKHNQQFIPLSAVDVPTKVEIREVPGRKTSTRK